jgi:hypothetical protein
MDHSRWNRTGGAAGIASVLASFVAARLTGTPPASDASNKAVQGFFIDHTAR